jgi:hypothetical protein
LQGILSAPIAHAMSFRPKVKPQLNARASAGQCGAPRCKDLEQTLFSWHKARFSLIAACTPSRPNRPRPLLICVSAKPKALHE